MPIPAPDSSAVDNLWQITVTTLFILSLINERIVNFIKLNLQQLWDKFPRWKLMKWLNQNIGNLRDKETNKAKEKLRERGILNLSIFVGFWIALFSKVDLFSIVKNHGIIQQQDAIPFCSHPWEFIKQLISFVFTGIFLSFGSKFWHDMLDLVFYASNLKSKTTDPNTFTVEKTEQLDEYLKFTGGDITEMAQNQYADTFKSRENVTYIAKGKRLVNGVIRDVLIVYLKDSDRSNIPQTLTVKLPSGRGVEVPVVIENNVDSIPKVQFGIGEGILKNGSVGTICCILKQIDTSQRESYYVLTCNHVLNNGNSTSQGGFKSDDIVQLTENLSGNWMYGLRTSVFDFALIQINIDDIEQTETDIKDKPIPIEGMHGKSILINGHQSFSNSGQVSKAGFIIGQVNDMMISYQDQNKKFVKLIELGDSLNEQQSDSISVGGDSGALIYDAQTKIPLAMLIAGNNRFSYAISLFDILEKIGGQITLIQ